MFLCVSRVFSPRFYLFSYIHYPIFLNFLPPSASLSPLWHKGESTTFNFHQQTFFESGQPRASIFLHSLYLSSPSLPLVPSTLLPLAFPAPSLSFLLFPSSLSFPRRSMCFPAFLAPLLSSLFFTSTLYSPFHADLHVSLPLSHPRPLHHLPSPLSSRNPSTSVTSPLRPLKSERRRLMSLAGLFCVIWVPVTSGGDGEGMSGVEGGLKWEWW